MVNVYLYIFYPLVFVLFLKNHLNIHGKSMLLLAYDMSGAVMQILKISDLHKAGFSLT